jgi:hypothetical protein
VSSFLNIDGNVGVKSVSIYNLLGSKLFEVQNTERIDVSSLTNGLYIIKVTTEEKEASFKFIKN